MTFSETASLVNAIEDIAKYSKYLTEAKANRPEDYDDIERLERWMERAKQDAFDIATK